LVKKASIPHPGSLLDTPVKKKPALDESAILGFHSMWMLWLSADFLNIAWLDVK
jgi:hypothetical protein